MTLANTSHSEDVETLERLVFEIDALTAIFSEDDDGGDPADGESAGQDKKIFSVSSPESLERARRMISGDDASELTSSCDEIRVPQIDIECYVRSSNSREFTYPKERHGSNSHGVHLRMSLPRGYPAHSPAMVTVLSTPKSFSRTLQDELSTKLRCKSEELVGSEAMMELINECRDVLSINFGDHSTVSDCDSTIGHLEEVCDHYPDKETTKNDPTGRIWVWVHHITNSERLKQIVGEARSRNLGGFVKGGYPGVVIAEGRKSDCNEFVTWIKGNKSRPNGFGRNWGHHVRGEETDVNKQLPDSFEKLEDDMGRLGALCKECGLENEFRIYILQHGNT